MISELMVGSPLHVLNVIIAIIATVMGLLMLATILRQRDPARLAWLEKPINLLLFLGLLIVLFTVLRPFHDIYVASKSIASSKTADPMVVYHALAYEILTLTLHLSIGTTVIIGWFLLRALHRFKLDRLETGGM